jgi:hypothetical protein
MSGKADTGKDVVFFIDEQKFKLEGDAHYTVRRLLELASEDPNETTLVLRHGHELTKFTDLDEVIEVRNGVRFAVFHQGPTPVS